MLVMSKKKSERIVYRKNHAMTMTALWPASLRLTNKPFIRLTSLFT